MFKDTIFYKAHGCGNDFICIDNRNIHVEQKQMPLYATTLCKRAFSIGADGILFIENTNEKDCSYKWHFYNSDGSRAQMCGNASRCVAKIAYLLGIAPMEHSFLSDAGIIKAKIHPDDDTVTVSLTKAKDVRINIPLSYKNSYYTGHTINTGVPHLVIFMETKEALETVILNEIGRDLRNNNEFSPEGVNVNFAYVASDQQIFLRTYERGVEAETQACGTGAAAVAYIARQLQYSKKSVHIIPTGKEILEIILEENTIYLRANASIVYKGTVL
ncbi:MAG: diaminopimelate epimerase [Desulfovibrionaceae bacterium]